MATFFLMLDVFKWIIPQAHYINKEGLKVSLY